VLSFVVPAYDEARLLPSTLAAIHRAAAAVGEPYEVVVADDASTDGTARVAAEHGARVVTAEHRQIAATRNEGARAARGDRLFFVDADTWIDAAVVRAALEALANGAVGGGSAVRLDAGVPLWARAALGATVWTFRHARLAAGCFLFCRRADFEAVGGFDERLYASEEIALSRALGRRGRFVVLREEVVTSGRKMRLYGTGELLRVFAGLALRGPRSVRRRRGLELWYASRREEGTADGPESPRGGG
jgi:glycosyltransferase involved in cell wall biosynthesis